MTCCDWTSDEAREQEPSKVALLGCGVVGSQVARLLREEADDLAVRIGARLELAGHRGAAARRTRGPASTRPC